ncbi:MAG TPA: hypothetical protein VK484_14700 [Ferruginibacter sp.]|nr:hypothetical protein [Ferruginibacter sp.]
MKRNFFLIFLFFFNYSFCQDAAWQQVRVDSFLTISLPQHFISNDTFVVKNGRTFKTRVLKASSGSPVLALTVMETDLRINPYDHESMGEIYAGVKYGFKKKAESQGFIVDMKDTVVNNVHGFKANVYTDDSRTLLNRICYGFCVSSLNYSIIVVPNENNIIESNKSLEKLLSLVRFNKEEILVKTSNENASFSFEKGEKLGKILAPVLLGIGIFIFFIYKSKKRKTGPQHIAIKD